MATSQETNLNHKVTAFRTKTGKDAHRCSCKPSATTHRMDWMSDEKWEAVKQKFFRRHS